MKEKFFLLSVLEIACLFFCPLALFMGLVLNMGVFFTDLEKSTIHISDNLSSFLSSSLSRSLDEVFTYLVIFILVSISKG